MRPQFALIFRYKRIMISSFKYSFEGKFDESAYLIFRWVNINVRLVVLPGNYFALTGILSCSLLFHFLISEKIYSNS